MVPTCAATRQAGRAKQPITLLDPAQAVLQEQEILKQETPDMVGLNEAITLAVSAHADQTDKAGQPYILHVLRVMLAQSDVEAMTVAALHDVVEDTDITVADLTQAGWSARIVTAVDALTRRDGEDYFDFALRAASNEVARPVKIADLRDNLRQSTDAGAQSRRERYLQALSLIGESP